MQKYTDVVQNRLGLTVEGAKVRVTDINGSVATIFSNNGTTQQSNPMTTDANGQFAFYAADGRYNLTVTINNVQYGEQRDILLNDPDDPSPEKIDGGVIVNSQVNESEVNDCTITGGTAQQVAVTGSTISQSELEDVTIDGLPPMTVGSQEHHEIVEDVQQLTAQSREALRRSYADAGFTLIDGSFEEGGTLTSSSDVLLHKASWKAYSWTGAYPVGGHVVSPGTDPTLSDSGYVLSKSNTEPGSGALMRVGGPAILDAERYVLERVSGGRQTIIRDAAGASNVMFVLPRFTYADIGMSADMGSGDVTAFDFGSGSIKSEIFIGAYLASDSGAVSAPMQDPRVLVTHTDARNACTAKGAGWHLMTAHEDAAIALWCMANGYEPIGNTNWGRGHNKSWLTGYRVDGNAPGDVSGIGRTRTGSMGPEANHDRSTHGIADLVGNVWEWRDGFLLQDGRFKISTHNTQAEANWSFIDAYLDASSTSLGAPILSNQIINRLGTIGDNANTGNFAQSDWRAMTKSSGYVSNQLLRRLLLEPSLTLPQGYIRMRNFGERLPFRGGDWGDGADAGLAAMFLGSSRVGTGTYLGFRPAFAS